MASPPRSRLAPHDPVRLLGNATCRAILATLRASPSYPREIGRRLGITEDAAQRLLHRLERAGLVAGAWRHDARRGLTIKEYCLVAGAVEVTFGAEGLVVRVRGSGGPA